MRSLAALASCNCICFWSRRGKSKRKELTSLFQVIGSQPNRLGPCPELSMGALPTQGLVLSCSLSGIISITGFQTWNNPSGSLTTKIFLLNYHYIKIPWNSTAKSASWRKMMEIEVFLHSQTEWNSLALMICHVFPSTESPADAWLDRNLSYRIPQKSLNSMPGLRKQKVH